MADYRAAVEEAKRLEKKCLEYSPYSGKINVEKTLDLSPDEVGDMNFNDLINLYERTEKITAARKKIYGMGEGTEPEKVVTKKETKKSKEIEKEMKKITTEALESAEEIKKEMDEKPIDLEVKTEAPKATKTADELEFDILDSELEAAKPKASAGFDDDLDLGLEEKTPAPKQVEDEMEFDDLDDTRKPTESTPPADEIELDTEEKVTPPVEEKHEDEFELEDMELPTKKEEVEPITLDEEKTEPVKEKESVVATKPVTTTPKPKKVPPVLKTEEKAVQKLESMDEKIRQALGGDVSKPKLKKRMLQLTKELFKEKSYNRREEIKMEITVLKNMLAGKVPAKAPVGKKGTVAKKAAVEKAAKGQLLETLVGTQKTGVANTKELILSRYSLKIKKMKSTFYGNLQTIPKEQLEKRKKLYEKLVLNLGMLEKKLPELITRYRDVTVQKHKTEMTKLRDSLGDSDTLIKKKIGSRLAALEGDYTKQFETVKQIVSKSISTVEELAGDTIEQQGTQNQKAKNIVREINETDGGTLLYYLHSKDPQYYKSYERKHVPKGEAISKARILMAKEKGLSDAMIRKYFGGMGG